MTAIRLTDLRSRWRALAFLASIGLAIAGIAGAGSADAGNTPAPPDFTYSSAATAVGVQVALQRQPDFSNLPDPLDVEIPDSEAQLDSFGTSQADGHVANLNGLGGIPGLICLFVDSPSFTCSDIPIGQITGGLIASFPPPDPLDAAATYPAHQTAAAPVVGTKTAQASFGEKDFMASAASATATAHQYDTSTSVAAQDLEIAGAVSIGHVATSTTQAATADGLKTTATAKLSDIGLGGTLLHIGAMTSTTTVLSRPGKPATDTTTTKLADVTVAGVPATIDASGIHVAKNGLPGNLVAAVQKLLDQVLKAAGIKVSLATVTRSNEDTGHNVAAYGLQITFDRTVKGTQPITIAPPKGVPCPPLIPPGSGLDPCSGVSFSLDGAYHGVVALGQVGVVSLAAPGGSGPGVSPGTGNTSPPTGPNPGGGLGTTPGGLPPSGPGVASSTPPVTPPTVAPAPQQVADQLGDVSHRLEWFFPLFAVGLLSLLGRFRVPSRLPGGSGRG